MTHPPDSEQPASEIVGAIILIGVIVMVFAFAGILLFSQPPSQKLPTLSVTTSINGRVIDIHHNGGDILSHPDMYILVNDARQDFSKNNDPSWTTWSVGESLEYEVPGTVPISSIKVIYDSSGTSAVLYSASFETSALPATVTTTPPIITHTIVASAGAGGSISPSGSVIASDGSDQSFTITPSPGYHIADVFVDSVSQGTLSNYFFTNVEADHTISASFAINTYTITASAGANGTITPAGVMTVTYGAMPAYTITPDTSYHVEDVLVNGTSVGAVTKYLFPPVTTNKTISAMFARNSRAQIYYEGFESGSTGWVLNGASRQNGIVPKNQTWSMRLRNTNSMYRPTTTANYESIVVQFAWTAQSLDSISETVLAEYSTDGGANWNTLSQITGPTASPTTLTIVTSATLPASAGNNANFQLRFRITGNNNNDLLYVDDVKITAIPM
ncbi:MAG: type IV pilin [Methanoregula sp.]